MATPEAGEANEPGAGVAPGYRILVTEPLSERGLGLLRDDGFEVDVRPGLAKEGLADAIGAYDALVVRSQTKVTADVIDAAQRLKVVARAGIGLDNVDIEAATRRGVMVVNAPQSNIVSAAEHTMALLLAQARNLPQADAALKAGRWERERFQGVELYGKGLGVIGLGRVGAMVAARAAAFGMRVLAYDPYVSRERGKHLGVELMPTLDALLVQVEFVTIHLPLNAETEGLIGARELGLMKDGARLVNTARGGIVDETALAEALATGRLGGAALDVFAAEPTTSSPLFADEHVVVTPHLGAATVEAQDKAGTTIAEMVRLALRGEFVPYAVNVGAGGEVSEVVRPFLGLAEVLGALVTGLAEGPIQGLEAEYLGGLADHDTRALTLAALRGSLSTVVHEPVSVVNAPVIAKERGVHVAERRSAVAQDYVNLMTVTAVTDAGGVAVSGTVVAKRDGARLVRVFDFDVDIAPARYMAFFHYEDRPGVIGRVGTLLGEAGVNIASMEVGRKAAGGLALMVLTVDSPIPPEVLAGVEGAIATDRAPRFLILPS